MQHALRPSHLRCPLPDDRAVAAIQRRVIKQSKRNVISRHLQAKNDKDKIAAWRSDLNRILHVFNVRSIASVGQLLTRRSQTELLVNTHVAVSEIYQGVANTHAVVSGLEHSVRDIHRTIVGGQGGNGNNESLVSDSHVP